MARLTLGQPPTSPTITGSAGGGVGGGNRQKKAIFDVKDIFITILDRQRNKKISQNKIPIMEIFSGLNPENLKFQIIPPVYLILEFQLIGDESLIFAAEKGGTLKKDDLEMKFEFRLSYDQRKSMVSK